MQIRVLAILSLLFAAQVVAGGGVAQAEIIVLKDGTTRQGTIESRDAKTLTLRLDRDGIKATLAIPAADIVRIEPSPPQPAPPPATTAPAASAPADPRTPLFAARTLDRRGFLLELASGFIGNGPDDPTRLPADQRALLDAAYRAEMNNQRSDVLQALRDLEASLRDVPGGMQRLDAVIERQRQQTFGEWMGHLHWDLISTKYQQGQFDLKDVRDVEKPVLIGLLREKTTPALDPLQAYFPPPDPKTGLPTPFKPAQLQGLSIGNVLEVRDKALFAAAVLLAQLKLEPDMPAVDRNLLTYQISGVNRVIGRCNELEPAARAAMVRAEMQRKIAETKAQRDLAMQKQKAALGTR